MVFRSCSMQTEENFVDRYCIFLMSRKFSFYIFNFIIVVFVVHCLLVGRNVKVSNLYIQKEYIHPFNSH